MSLFKYHDLLAAKYGSFDVGQLFDMNAII